ncbi:MAG: type II toxin-antitoxin system VapC family toxin [Chlorobium sp.]|uniref:Ribonuclease VapC n=2 Tax=Chlorobium/Pelodictyon group TaxID=274493 RepID=Q3B1Q7_CHLL3|nr:MULTISPECIES: type II toxin-antitoxin system VapC family toxin [Chlorobium/Pelodictyon group]ABB24724.1 plasmid stabilization protein StbB-like protein [Pelodictyon luteolum DSM 273]MDT9547538.1 type II toxin-antitoxin system VapC family toxin [Chlorobium phaeovibrioides]NQU45435.1 type II toxin-antitoxin system VapC family toxin [Chlorobium sp.]RTY38357.1 type II toxin-antitoxin system VapC family toxin [Chlorobium phaeovibrioides]
MIILDTNVLSALMQQQPDPKVVKWVDSQPSESIWLSSITLFEARYGLALLPSGQRKSLLENRFEELLSDEMQHRILLFDADAAKAAALLAAERKEAGRPIDMRDTFIAGIALANSATIATRNIRHFSDLSVAVVNPWEC